MSKGELADHLADVHGIWLTRREYREMSYEDVQARASRGIAAQRLH